MEPKDSDFLSTGISCSFKSRKELRGRGIPLCVKVSPLELDLINKFRGQIPLSKFIRDSVLKKIIEANNESE